MTKVMTFDARAVIEKYIPIKDINLLHDYFVIKSTGNTPSSEFIYLLSLNGYTSKSFDEILSVIDNIYVYYSLKAKFDSRIKVETKILSYAIDNIRDCSKGWV